MPFSDRTIILEKNSRLAIILICVWQFIRASQEPGLWVLQFIISQGQDRISFEPFQNEERIADKATIKRSSQCQIVNDLLCGPWSMVVSRAIRLLSALYIDRVSQQKLQPAGRVGIKGALKGEVRVGGGHLTQSASYTTHRAWSTEHKERINESIDRPTRATDGNQQNWTDANQR